jgi:Ni/Co efflux regulator RcnB
MNTLVKALVLSISTALVAAPVMAAPQEHQPQKPQAQMSHKKAPEPMKQQQTPQNKPYAQNNAKHTQGPQHKAQKNRVNPSHDWKKGQKVPSEFRGQRYKVDHNQHRNLSKPSKNQQWIKVNGDYVLMNAMNYTIIKILAG